MTMLALVSAPKAGRVRPLVRDLLAVIDASIGQPTPLHTNSPLKGEMPVLRSSADPSRRRSPAVAPARAERARRTARATARVTSPRLVSHTPGRTSSRAGPPSTPHSRTGPPAGRQQKPAPAIRRPVVFERVDPAAHGGAASRLVALLRRLETPVLGVAACVESPGFPDPPRWEPLPREPS